MTISQIRHTLETCSHLFDTSENFHLSAQVIANVVRRTPQNDSFEFVFEKTILINTLYSTMVYDTITMAKHIVRSHIDSKLQSADLTVISDLRAGHGIRAKRGAGKEFDFYSFATKYAAFHRPDIFPLFDSYVMRLLSEFNRTYSFTAKFAQYELRDYIRFKQVVDDFSKFVGMESFLYQRFDHALWLLGKYKYNSKRLEDSILQRISQSCMS